MAVNKNMGGRSAASNDFLEPLAPTGVTGTNIPAGATVTSYTSGTNTLVIGFASSTVTAGSNVTLSFTAPATQSYNITPITTNGSGSSVIKSAGDGSVDVQQLKVDGYKIIDTNSTHVEFYSPRASGTPFNFLSSNGVDATGVTSIKNTLEIAGNTKIGVTATPATLEVTVFKANSSSIPSFTRSKSSDKIDFGCAISSLVKLPSLSKSGNEPFPSDDMVMCSKGIPRLTSSTIAFAGFISTTNVLVILFLSLYFTKKSGKYL